MQWGKFNKSRRYKQYKKDPFLNEIYPQNPETGNLIIEILLEKHIYLFNEWDNASFKRRDLDPDLIYFLEECFQEIPLRYELQLNIAITEEERNYAKEEEIIKGIKTQYTHYLRAERRKLSQLFMRAFLYVATAFILLLASSMLESVLGKHPLSNALSEGFNIGGWVFAWEAVSSFSFQRGEVVRKIKEYERFLRAPIQFVYTKRKLL